MFGPLQQAAFYSGKARSFVKKMRISYTALAPETKLCKDIGDI